MSDEQGTWRLENVRVWGGQGFSAPTTVSVRNRRLTDAADAVPGPGLEGAGRYLVPGLIDAHMHVVQGASDLDQLARHGVTTGLDMACWPADFVARMKASTGGAAMFSSGTPAVGRGGNHARMPGFPASGIVTSPAEAADFVARRVDEGADYIKIVTEAEPPEGMDQATVDALVSHAHRRGLLVVAHSVTIGAFDVSIRAGVDISTHAPVDGVLRDDQVEAMRAQGMVSCPTLIMMTGVARARQASGARYEHAQRSVTALHQAGVPILVGTDSNSAPGAPFAPQHGASMAQEFALLAAAGLSPAEVLEAATSAPARVFGLSDRGRIAPGLRADLVLLRHNPLEDIAAIGSVDQVWVDGVATAA